jgi:hypothetical protein
VKKLGIVLLLIVVVLIVGLCYLFQPHIAFEEVRMSNTPFEIKAVYVNVTGDPLCAKLYRLERMEGSKPVASDKPIFLALPKGLPSPDEGKFAHSDNLFLINGYSYQFKERNKLTGNSKSSPSNRVDVIAWEVIPPYKKWKKGDPGNTTPLEAETASTPVKYRMKSSDHRPSQFTKGNYVDCLR